MEFNQPSQIVKDLNFGSNAKDKILKGVEQLANAVQSTLGASGKCVIYEDALGKPVITKDGVTVAESVVLYDPVENIGATLIKEAAKNTVKEAGDGTTTATVLAYSLLNEIEDYQGSDNIRNIKNGIQSGYEKVVEYLSKHSKTVSGDMLTNVASISCNNDEEIGGIIADAYNKVGKDSVVLLEESQTAETYADIVDGVQLKCPLTSKYLITDKGREVAELDNPYVLIAMTPIQSIRSIQPILEHVIKKKRSLLIVGSVEEVPKSALLANKVKGNIKLNIIESPGFGPTKEDTIEDLATVTGAKIINESLGDDFDLVDISFLGEAVKSVTDNKNTILTIDKTETEFVERIKLVKKAIKKEKDPFMKKKLQERLAILSGNVGIVRVGANSQVELKEKKDRVEDAIYATKAALQEGIVPGGGIALLNAATNIVEDNDGETILSKSIIAPFRVILENAGLEVKLPKKDGFGIDVTTGEEVDMIKNGIIDPVLVTKTALKNAVSVVKTIVSADCIISNKRANDASS
jgi:chaperonin GroEL